jgi:hypothetical protein
VLYRVDAVWDVYLVGNIMKNIIYVACFLAVSAIPSAPAFAESCGDTSFSALAASDCRGSFVGNIGGGPSDIAAQLSDLSSFGWGTFSFEGKSDDGGSGPFTSNLGGTTNVTLTFDSAISGTFVLGLKAANQYSYYLFDALSPVSSLTFSSTAGVALNGNLIPQGLSHANLYTATTPVPEPGTYAMLIAGLGLMGIVARRRNKKTAVFM